MDILEFLKIVTERLNQENVKYAMAGGFAASAYRDTERATKDIDLLILAESNTEEIAKKIITEFGLTPHVIRQSDIERNPRFSKKTTPTCLILGRDKEKNKIHLDFILQGIPWFESAIERAQNNIIELNFGSMPYITVEDVIISKLYSLYNDSKRFNDLDDLKSIFQAKHNLDLAYISGQMRKLKIKIPLEIKEFAPSSLWKVSRRINIK